ncbi:MAG: methyltransferase, partial [Spirochaetia bacterium]|nr:methyltransferase [Spirochaetia bacterium]
FLSGNRNQYRNQIRVHSDGTHVGFYRIHSRDIVPLPAEGCLNISKNLNESIQEYFYGRKRTGSFRFREHGGKTFSPNDLDLQKTIMECIPFFGDGIPNPFPAENFNWEIPADGFFQQNQEMLLPWLFKIAEMIPGGNPDTAELFSGNSLIGGFLRKQLGNYQGFESHKISLDLARKNFNRMGLQGRFKKMDLYREAPELKTDLVIANPPRAGLKKKILEKLKERKGTLIYSSCNPHTMNGDIKFLLNSGYSCTHSAVFDFFPCTPHLELVLSLVK